MANPRAVVPYHDPHDSPFDPESLDFITDILNPSLQDIHQEQQPSLHDTFPNEEEDIVTDYDDTFDAQFLWDDVPEGNAQEGPLQFSDQSRRNTSYPRVVSTDAEGEENIMQLSIWPQKPSPYSCSFCHVLREIVHVNEATNHVAKLEVHGRVGIISHAILDEGMNVHGAEHQYHMFDFCKKSLEDVKVFLMEYCSSRKQAGYTMHIDPLSLFYEALCVGLNEIMTSNQVLFQPNPINSVSGSEQMNQGYDENENADMPPKISLSEQRERTGKLTLRDITGYFDLPIDEASKQLNLCSTVIKKVCRKNGVMRWPYRKIQSLKNKIEKCSGSLNSDMPEVRAQAEAELNRLRQELADLYRPPP